MNEREVAEAVRDWARATVPEINAGYAYPVTTKLGELPDVVAVVKEVRIAVSDPAFPFAALAQSWLRVFDVEASVMVAVEDGDDYTETEENHRVAHQELQRIGSVLRDAIATDADLGGRVPFASPIVRTGYEPPFDDDEDGTRGRLLFLFLSIGEAIEEPG